VSHDYDPTWDYELDTKPAVRVVAVMKAAEEDLTKTAAALGLEKPRVYFVKDLEGDHLARYVNGTSSEPVFVLDAKKLERAARQYKIDLETTVVTTLHHELAHAYLESLGLEGEDQEEMVERFAEICWHSGSEEGVDWLKAQGYAKALQLG
jgi:hypothetical protein